MEDSRIKINFSCEIFISHVELKQFTSNAGFHINLVPRVLFPLPATLTGDKTVGTMLFSYVKKVCEIFLREIPHLHV